MPACKADPGYTKFDREAAKRVLAEKGDTLSMDTAQTIRAGDMGRVLLYLPYALWRGDTRDPRLAPTHAVAFTLALGALYAAFWWVRDPVLGAAAVALLGSNPYQLYEVHFRENVFGWAITAGVLALALSLPLLQRRAVRRAWALPLAIGVILGTIRQIRPEPGAIVVSAGLACLLAARVSWPRRAALAAVLVASFLGTSAAWQGYFDRKFDEATRVVSAAGGRVYHGPRDRYHAFWHPLWCGLGDFGQKHGYEWRDKAAAHYAAPIVQERYRALGREPNWSYLFWDPVYYEVLADKVRSRHHARPGLVPRSPRAAHRAGLHLDDSRATRRRSRRLDLPWNGLLTVPLLLGLAATRSWHLLKLAAFPLGTSLPAVLVFSGTYPGQTYMGWFHVIAASLVLSALIDVGRELGRRTGGAGGGAERAAAWPDQRLRCARRSASRRSTIRP